MGSGMHRRPCVGVITRLEFRLVTVYCSHADVNGHSRPQVGKEVEEPEELSYVNLYKHSLHSSSRGINSNGNFVHLNFTHKYVHRPRYTVD